MARSRRDRDRLRADVLRALRFEWGGRGPVQLVLQDGRKRPRVTGRVVYVATSGAYALLDDGEGDDRLHVPVDHVRRVSITVRGGLREVVPKPQPVPDRKDQP